MNSILDAIRHTDIDRVWKMLADDPKQIEIVDIRGSTPLHLAAARNMTGLIKICLEKNIEVNSRNSAGCSPLFFACLAGAESAAKLLLDRGADVNMANENFASPLFMAARNGHSQLVEMLLRHGGNLYLPNINGVTAYEIAFEKGHEEIAEFIARVAQAHQEIDGNDGKVVCMQDFRDRVVND